MLGVCAQEGVARLGFFDIVAYLLMSRSPNYKKLGGRPMRLVTLLQIVGLSWMVSEILLAMATRRRRRTAVVRDRGSLAVLWATIATGISAGIFLSTISATRIPIPWSWLLLVSLLLLVGGLAIRWVAIITLGRFFTATVAIHSDHRVISTGIYRRIRHPSYSGLLLAFLGLALAYGNWLSLIAIFVPITAAVLYRIRVEEASMVEGLGQEYLDYRRSTDCLIPGVY
jgi:protein-S-isoprenylcysteine O-methyltransferase Ste14